MPLAGMNDHVTWGSQGRRPKSPAGKSIHKWHLSYTDSFAFLVMSWQISSNLPPEAQEWRGSSFLPLPKHSCISCTRIATLFHVNWCTEPKAFCVFSCCSRSVLNQVAPETSATFFKDFYKVQKPPVLRMWH